MSPRLRQTLPILTAWGLGAMLLLPVPSAAAVNVNPLSSGAGWFDCNNDDHLDLLYMQPDGRVALLIWDPGLAQLVDVTETSLPSAIQYQASGFGVACGDLNNDGWEDLFLTLDGLNRLLLNQGDGTFALASRAAGITGEVLSASVALFDYDRDGDLDIYIANYAVPPFDGLPNQLYRCDSIDINGIPHYTDVAPALGVDLAQNGESNWSLGVAVADYDNDGDQDLYVANDYDGINIDTGDLNDGDNILYRNEGDGTFTDVSYAAGAAQAGWAMGTAFGDYNQDGWLDIFVANFWEDALLRNNGNGTFTEVTAAEGIMGNPGQIHNNGWGTSFLDFDNDGDLDISVNNGYTLNSDHQDWEDQPNELWENRGPGVSPRFIEVGAAAGIADVGHARGAAYADYNRDGFVDFLVINNDYLQGAGLPRLLFINQKDGTFRDRASSQGVRTEGADGNAMPPRGDFSQNDWVQVHPVGTYSNRSAIGARVTVKAGGKTWIQDRGAGSYLGCNSPWLHFGLGEVEMIDEITVRFPRDGRTVTLTNLVPNQFLTVTEPDVVPVRLLGFDAEPVVEGARLTWRYVDDGGLAAFALSRRMDGVETLLAPRLLPRGGVNTYLDQAELRGPVLYVLEALHRDGSREQLGTASLPERPAGILRLGQNAPNPFREGTGIPVRSPEAGPLRVHIFDASGRLIRTLEGSLPVGAGSLHWDGADDAGRPVPSGAYFYRLAEGGPTYKMIRRR